MPIKNQCYRERKQGRCKVDRPFGVRMRQSLGWGMVGSCNFKYDGHKGFIGMQTPEVRSNGAIEPTHSHTAICFNTKSSSVECISGKGLIAKGKNIFKKDLLSKMWSFFIRLLVCWSTEFLFLFLNKLLHWI